MSISNTIPSGEDVTARDTSLRALASDCVKAFEACHEVYQATWLIAHQAAFRLWLVSSGASQIGRSSLDMMLQDTGQRDARSIIAGLLRRLRLVLNDFARGPPDQREAHDERFNTMYPAVTPATARTASSDSVYTGPAWNMTSIHEEMLNARPTVTRGIDKSVSSDDSEDSFTSDSPQHVIGRIITHLSSTLAVARQGERSRLERAFDESEHVVLRQHLTNWLLARQARQAGTTTQGLRPSEMQEGLVQVNLRRAHRLMQAQTRSASDSAASDGELGATDTISIASELSNESQAQTSEDINTLTRSWDGTEMLPGMEVSAGLAPGAVDGRMRGDSFASDSILFPDQPEVDGTMFECRYCCQQLSTDVAKDRTLWHDHLINDLAPYSCFVPGCGLLYETFAEVQDWKSHLFERHGEARSWVCTICANRFTMEPAFEAHLSSVHAEDVTSETARSMLSTCIEPLLKLTQCPICGWRLADGSDQQSLLQHVAQELRVFAMQVLPDRTKLHRSQRTQSDTAAVASSPKKVKPGIVVSCSFKRPDLGTAILHATKYRIEQGHVILWRNDEMLMKHDIQMTGSGPMPFYTTRQSKSYRLTWISRVPIESNGMTCMGAPQYSFTSRRHFKDFYLRLRDLRCRYHVRVSSVSFSGTSHPRSVATIEPEVEIWERRDGSGIVVLTLSNEAGHIVFAEIDCAWLLPTSSNGESPRNIVLRFNKDRPTGFSRLESSKAPISASKGLSRFVSSRFGKALDIGKTFRMRSKKVKDKATGAVTSAAGTDLNALRSVISEWLQRSSGLGIIFLSEIDCSSFVREFWAYEDARYVSKLKSAPSAITSSHDQQRISTTKFWSERPSEPQTESQLVSQLDMMHKAPTVETKSNRVYTSVLKSGQIRLLTILPGRTDEGLRLAVNVSSLDTADCQYEALSYAWGSAADTETAAIDAALDYQIPRHLARGLKSIRLPDRSRTVWVDAICINQNDAIEKSAQIALLGKIYRNAIRTLVYYDVPTAGDLCERRFSTHEDTDRRLLCATSYSAHDHQLDSSLQQIADMLPTTQTIAPSAWSLRMWCVQEFYLSASTPIVHIGSHAVEWPVFESTIPTLHNLEASISLFSRLEKLRHQKMPLHQAFLMCEELTVDNPKDRVFAVLHACTAGTMVPTYNQSVEEVYEQAVLTMIQTSASLDVLMDCRADRTPKSGSITATYIPDLTQLMWPEKVRGRPGYNSGQSVTHAQLVPYAAQTAGPSKLLRIQAKYFDTVQYCTDIAEDMAYEASPSGELLYNDFSSPGRLVRYILRRLRATYQAPIRTSQIGRLMLEYLLQESRHYRDEIRKCREFSVESWRQQGCLHQEAEDEHYLTSSISKTIAGPPEKTTLDLDFMRRHWSRKRLHDPVSSIIDVTVDVTYPQIVGTYLNDTSFVEDMTAALEYENLFCYARCTRQSYYMHRDEFFRGMRRGVLDDLGRSNVPDLSASTAKDDQNIEQHPYLAKDREREFFSTRRGTIGLGPATVSAGDIIVVARGASRPLILRPSLDGAFMLVGEALVPGIMHGQWINEEAVQVQDFDLR